FLTIPVLIIRNYAWQLVQKEQKIKIPFFQSLKIHLIGYFYGIISPGYIGQLIKVPHMKEHTGEPYGKLFINVFIDTVIRTLSLYVMMVIGGLIIIGLFPELFYITVAWIIILSIILLYFIKKERGEKLLYSLVRYFTPKKLRNHLNRFIDTFYKDFPSIKRLFFPLLLGGFTWIIIFTQEYIIVLALGLNIPYLYFLLLYPIANAAGFIPISFAGLGVREYTAILLFSTIFSIEGEKIFVLSLMGFLITTVLKGFIGFLLSLTETRKTELIRHTP
ncbi:MAG: flippase-like domain-containing protein, partial [Thermoplasmatales archaeon]|nr:flippase-like domain-containing protein [Thermoplasmatales archaeon]